MNVLVYTHIGSCQNILSAKVTQNISSVTVQCVSHNAIERRPESCMCSDNMSYDRLSF